MEATLSKRFDKIDSITLRRVVFGLVRREETDSPNDAELDRLRLESAKVATSMAFALNGWAFATWSSRIPSIRDALAISPQQLGLLLLIGSAGSVLGLPLAGRVAQRIGTARTILFGAALELSALALIGLTVDVLQSVPLTAAALFLFTFGMGQWDVAMNLEGATVEHRLHRTIMPRYHAAFSLGTVGGALVGAALAWLVAPLIAHVTLTAVVVAVLIVGVVRAFLPREDVTRSPDEADAADAAAQPTTRSAWTEPRTLLIGLVVLVVAFTEGAADDWMSVAFIDGYGLPEWAGILGLATFLSFMTLSRVIGTKLLDTYGRVPLLRVLLVLAGAGSLLVVFGTPVLAFVGAAIWGFGVALGFPVGMSAAADEPQRAPARVSVVSTIGYLAFLAGPPLLGFLGDHYGVLRALSVVSLLLVVALVALPAVKPLPAPQAKTLASPR